MSLITPVLDLTFQQNTNAPNDYFLDSAATFTQSNFVANGQGPVPTSLDENDELNITLFVTEDDSLPSNNGSVTVDHFVALGNLDFGVADLKINVSVFDQASQLKGKGHVRTSSAREISKPIESQG